MSKLVAPWERFVRRVYRFIWGFEPSARSMKLNPLVKRRYARFRGLDGVLVFE